MSGGFFGILGGSCCCFLLVIVVAIIVWKMMSRNKTPPPASFTDNRPVSAGAPAVGRMAQYGNIISDISDEGFYIFNQYLTPGSMVHYRYRTDGGWVTRSVPYQPGPRGHFVYLGSTPQDLQVTDVVPAGTSADAPEDPMRTMIVPTATVPQRRVEAPIDDRPSPPPAAAAGNYPSAY
jgi:hypothetical protein